MYILQCMGSQLCVKSQRGPLKIETKVSTHTPQKCILRGIESLTTYDILELWHILSLSETGFDVFEIQYKSSLTSREISLTHSFYFTRPTL